MTGIVFMDGQFIPPEDAKMSIFDAGFIYSDVYEHHEFYSEQHEFYSSRSNWKIHIWRS